MPPAHIVMYARERPCPDVTRSRERLRELDLPWTEFDIESNDMAATTVEELTGQRRIPTILIGETVLMEPSNDELDEALSNAGFDISVTSRSN
ncbi:hypothetical protein BH23CHL3_BH23CHL3_00720 [soil metagenome]|jgi:glutaredoxin